MLVVHKSDIIQLIVSERQTRHCLFCISYRGIESESKLATLTGELESQGALMWKIRLGSIEVEVVNSLVSETLVSLNQNLRDVVGLMH